MASKANDLHAFEGKKRHSVWSSAVAQIEADRFVNGVKTSGVK